MIITSSVYLEKEKKFSLLQISFKLVKIIGSSLLDEETIPRSTVNSNIEGKLVDEIETICCK